MVEEYTPQFSEIPDMQSLLMQRIANKVSDQPTKLSGGGFDPHASMVKRNKIEKGEELPEIPEAPRWPEEDVQELQNYCQRMGIIGFSTRQNPKIALMQLKKQMGDFDGISLEERVPHGYEKKGTPNNYNANFPYNHIQKPGKNLLNG